MSVEKILSGWKKKHYKPVTWLEGEESYYIDELVDYAENNILSPDEASFNLTVFYGKDADWAAIINACRRYPMFSERQVVILKEAQGLKDIEKLEPYIISPLLSTVFIVAYKEKHLDKRTKLYKTVNAEAEFLSTKKISESKLPEWIREHAASKGFTINGKAAALLEEHIGNDLSRIAGEIEKLAVNLQTKKSIDEDDIEKYIGISKEYNVFELQASLARKDLASSLKIINYFEANPKAGVIQMVLPALYSWFSKVWSASTHSDWSVSALKPLFYFNETSASQARAALQAYGPEGVERIILLMHAYNLKSVGIGDNGNSGATLMKEMVAKMIVD